MARTEAEASRKDRSEGSVYETVKVVVQALLIAFVVQLVLFQPFSIPSGSLIPTLLIGDYLFVSKYTYGYSRHSIPFFSPPVFSGRIFASQPKRGDIAVFKLPKDGSTVFIKRVIGLPGDKIRVVGGILHINGQAVKRERIEDYRMQDVWRRQVAVPQYLETLPNSVTHRIIEIDGDKGPLDDTDEYLVPPGFYFMMGDNRDNSADSRDTAQVGLVPFENLVGRAEVIFFSIDDDASVWKIWEWPWTVRWSRIFTSIK
jgi:signal peptidase I